jgi:hypothetical protein
MMLSPIEKIYKTMPTQPNISAMSSILSSFDFTKGFSTPRKAKDFLFKTFEPELIESFQRKVALGSVLATLSCFYDINDDSKFVLDIEMQTSEGSVPFLVYIFDYEKEARGLVSLILDSVTASTDQAASDIITSSLIG